MPKTRVVSYSELDALRQCPLKRHLAYTERWVLPTTSPALNKGKLWHEVLELHYRSLMEHPLEAAEGLVRGLIEQAECDEELRELMHWMYSGYVECYGAEQEWEVLHVEYPVEEWLRNARGNRTHFRIKGKVDLLVRDHSSGGGLWVVDHKSCKNLPKDRNYDFDDQFAIYTWLLKQKGLDIRGVIHNACRTEKLKTRTMTMKERFARHLTVRTDKELETMTLEALAEFRQGDHKATSEGDLPQRRPDRKSVV